MATSFLQAADEILRGAERLLSTQKITERALARGLVTTDGRTPVNTMSARLYAAAAAGKVKRVYEPGITRAKRGSVRWLPVE